MSAVGYVVGEVRTDEFTFVTNTEIAPPRLEYIVLPGLRERTGGGVQTIDVLAQVTGLTVSSRLLSPDMSHGEVEAILNRLRSAPPIIVGTAKVLGYLDERNIVRFPRGAASPGAEVHTASDALLKRFFSRVDASGLEIGALINRPQVSVACDPNGLRRHLAVIAQTGAGKSYTVGVLLEQLLQLGGTVIVFDPNSDYVLMRKDERNQPTSFSDRVEVYRLPTHIKGRYTDAETGPTRKFQVQFSKLELEEIFALCGLPEGYARIRTAVEFAYKRIQGMDYTPTQLRKELERMGSYAAPTADNGKRANSRQRPLSDAFGDEDSFSDFAHKQWTQKSGVDYEPKPSAGPVGWDDLASGSSDDEEAPPARSVPVGPDPIAEGSLPPDVVQGALSAVKYIQALEKMDIWGFEDVPLDSLLKPMTLSAVDLAGMDSRVADYVVAKVLNDTWRRAVSEGLSRPVFFVLEEAHNFIPNSQNRGEVAHAASVIRRISAEGRKFGIFLILITQRPYKVHSDVLSQCNSQIIMRLTNPQDQTAIKQAAEGISEGLLADLPGLNVGEAVILGPLVRVPVMVRINPRESREGGADLDVVKALERAKRDVESVRREEQGRAERRARPRRDFAEEV